MRLSGTLTKYKRAVISLRRRLLSAAKTAWWRVYSPACVPLDRASCGAAANISPSDGSLLFYTSATGWYLPFFPLYVYFAHQSNPGCSFEFIVDSANDVELNYSLVLDYLRRDRGIQISFRNKNEASVQPSMENTLRFVLPPQQVAEFVYIGDIDILIIENVMHRHGAVFDAGLPYSNVIRPGTKKLTGLHLTKYDAYFPLSDVDKIVSTYSNDEEVLYRIVERSGKLKRQPEIDGIGVGRPQHGIHMSLNRIPFMDWAMRVDWGISWDYVKRTHAVISGKTFQKFVRRLPYASRLYLANIYFLVKAIANEGEEAFSMLIDKHTDSKTSTSIFTNIYATNAWGAESRSGPSSGMERTKTIRSNLPKIIDRYHICSMLDAPCGDLFWMKSLLPTLVPNYIGGDIVKDVISDNIIHHGRDGVTFTVLDLTKDAFPKSDLFFCRDCLFHLSYRHIALVFQNFLNSDCKFIMTTSHINNGRFVNSDIETGDWRWFDLFLDPFNLPETYIESIIDGGGDRYMYLWRKEDVADGMVEFINNHLK